jgi:branched-chain amino acid transport system permease protein
VLQSALVGLFQSGGAYGLLAVCVVLIYRTTGVLNFALAAVGTTGTYAFSSFYTSGMNLAEAAIFGILIGVAASVVCGLIYIRWFFDATPTYRAGVAIALLVGTAAITIRIFSDEPRQIPAVIPGSGFSVDGVVLTPTSIAGIALAILFTLFVTQMLQRTRWGLQLRAISQGPVASELLGLPVRPLTLAIWGGSGAIGTIAVMIVSPGLSDEVQSISLVIVPALAATLVATFRRYWLALISALILGGLQGLLLYSQTLIRYEEVIPFMVVLGVLIWNQRRELWDEAR